MAFWRPVFSGLFIAVAVFVALVLPSGGASGAEGGVWMERWRLERPLGAKRAGLAAARVGSSVCAIGGGVFNGASLGILGSVECAAVGKDGRLGEWKAAPDLKTPRVYPAAVVYNGHVYVMGGETLDRVYTGGRQAPPELLSTVERARINTDGTLGEWTLEPEKMTRPRRGGELYAHKGRLYSVGGFDGAFLSDVESAEIRPDGSVGPWRAEPGTAGQPRYISGYVEAGGVFYLVGGHLPSEERALDSVEAARVADDGTLAAWNWQAPLRSKVFLNAVAVAGANIYSIAGHNTINLAGVQRAAIGKDGTLSAWEPDTPLNTAKRAAAAVAYGDRVYVLGGMTLPMGLSVSLDEVESAALAQGGGRLGNGGDITTDIEAYREWKAAPPLDAVNHLSRAAAMLGRGNYKAVIFDSDEALKAAPASWRDAWRAHNMKGQAYYAMGLEGEAWAALKASVARNPDDFIALMGLGMMSYDGGRMEDAALYYREAARVGPGSADAHFNLGQSYLGMADYKSAAAEFDLALKIEPWSKRAEHLRDEARKKAALPGDGRLDGRGEGAK